MKTEHTLAGFALYHVGDYLVERKGTPLVGVPAHALLISLAAVEAVLTHALLIMAKTGQLLTSEESAQWLKEKVVDPLHTHSAETTAAVGVVAARFVTSFKGEKEAKQGDAAIEANVEALYGFSVEEDYPDKLSKQEEPDLPEIETESGSGLLRAGTAAGVASALALAAYVRFNRELGASSGLHVRKVVERQVLEYERCEAPIDWQHYRDQLLFRVFVASSVLILGRIIYGVASSRQKASDLPDPTIAQQPPDSLSEPPPVPVTPAGGSKSKTILQLFSPITTTFVMSPASPAKPQTPASLLPQGGSTRRSQSRGGRQRRSSRAHSHPRGSSRRSSGTPSLGLNSAFEDSETSDDDFDPDATRDPHMESMNFGPPSPTQQQRAFGEKFTSHFGAPQLGSVLPLPPTPPPFPGNSGKNILPDLFSPGFLAQNSGSPAPKTPVQD